MPELKHDYEEITLDVCCLDCKDAVFSLKNNKIKVNCWWQEGEHGYCGLCLKHEFKPFSFKRISE